MSEQRSTRGGAVRGAGLSIALLCAAGCASAPESAPPRAAPATHSAVILADGDPVVTAAVHRVVLAGHSRVVESLLEDGAFNETLSDAEAEAFLALAQRIEVKPDVGPRDPERGARRLLYAVLASRVIATGNWHLAEEWWDAADDEQERNDLAAGFAVTDWWPAGRVAVARSPEELDAWRETFARLLAETTDLAARRRLVRNAHGKLGLLPRSPAEPEEERLRGAAFIRRLIAVEKDDETRAGLVHALSLGDFALPAELTSPGATPTAPSTTR